MPDCRFCRVKFQARVRCGQIKTDAIASNEDRFSRRDVLQGFGGTIALVRAIFFFFFFSEFLHSFLRAERNVFGE